MLVLMLLTIILTFFHLNQNIFVFLKVISTFSL